MVFANSIRPATLVDYGSLVLMPGIIDSHVHVNKPGTLRAGDEILAINGSSLDRLTHAKTLQMFKNTKGGNLILHVVQRDLTHKWYMTQSKLYNCLNKLTKSADE